MKTILQSIILSILFSTFSLAITKKIRYKMKLFVLLLMSLTIFIPFLLFAQTKNNLITKVDNLSKRRYSNLLTSEQVKQHLTDKYLSKQLDVANKTNLNNGFLLVEEINQDWDGSNWVNDYLLTFTYYGIDNMIEKLERDWDGSNWVDYLKWTYSYDGNNNLIVELVQQCYGSFYVNANLHTYTYDGNNILIERLWQDWYDPIWVNVILFTYTYNVNNNLIEELWQLWDGSNWMNMAVLSFTYDGNNNLIEWLWQEWRGSNWTNWWFISFTYDGNNNLIEELNQNWDGSNWVNEYLFTRTYDGNDNMIEELNQNWDGSNWVNEYLFTFTYDANNILTESLRQNWNGSNWVNYDKNIYSYIPTGIEKFDNIIATYSLFQNHPNPFNPSTTIEFSIPKTEHVTLKIYNLLGQEVATLVSDKMNAGNYTYTWDASGFASGVYFYKIQVGDPATGSPKGQARSAFVQTRKLILLR